MNISLPAPLMALVPPRRHCNIALKVATVLMFVGFCALVALLWGCATPTPKTPADLAIEDVTRAEALYLLATTPIDIAIGNGDIKGQTAVAIQAAEDKAQKYLSAARTAAKTGTPIDAETQLELFEQARTDLIKAFTKAKPAATTAPTTAPGGSL